MARGRGRKKADEPIRYANAMTAAIFVASFVILVLDYYAGSLGVVNQIIVALGTLLISGAAIKKLKSLKGGYGIYMLAGKRGISTVDSLSKRNAKFWKSMAMWGLVMGFGILSYPLLKGKVDKRLYALGIISILFFLYFVIPCTPLSFQFIRIAQLKGFGVNAAAECIPSFSGLTPYGYLIYGATALSGFSGFLILSLMANAMTVFSSSISYGLSVYSGNPQPSLLTNLVPGVAPVIPGITIPLIAGILALAIILTIHEFSHGVLARLAKVKIKSIGLLLFGVIPIGAFVEPDEKTINKLDLQSQNNISAAGISSNFLAAIFFFVLTFIFLIYVVPYIYQNKGVFIESVLPNSPANGVLSAGMQILYWNGHQVSNITSLELAGANTLPGSQVNVVTNKGSYTFNAVSISGSTRGEVGITPTQETAVVNTTYGHTMDFLYKLFSLSFILNFLVAIVNLLPVPGFDGYRIYRTNIKGQFFIRFVTFLIIVGLVLNTLPWLYIGILH